MSIEKQHNKVNHFPLLTALHRFIVVKYQLVFVILNQVTL